MAAKLVAFMLAISLAAPAALAQSPESEPTSAWVLERAPARCVVSRSYGSAADPVILGLKAAPMGDAIQMVILRPGYRNWVGQSTARIAMGGHEAVTTALSYPIAGRRRAADLINLAGEDSAALRGAREIEVRVKDGVKRSFSLAPAKAAWDQLDACLARVRTSWNLDETRAARIASPARPLAPLASAFSDQDFPRGITMSGATGFVLLIDETGKVQDCTLTETSGIAQFDARSCAIIVSRAKFEPARDVDGHPVKGAIGTRVRWVAAS